MKRVLSLRRSGAAVLAGLVFCATISPSVTHAQSTDQPAARPAVRTGRVAVPTASSFVLETRTCNVTVTVTDQTWVVVEREGRAVEGAISDLVPGKPAYVAGMLSADGKALSARAVAQGPLAQRLADRLSRSGRKPLTRAVHHLGGGTITAIEGSTITLRGDRVAEIRVITRPETVVLRGGFADVGTLKVGELVQVLGVPVRAQAGDSGARTLEAWAIRVDSGTTGFFHGRVARADGNNLVLHNVRGRDRITLVVDANTQYKRVAVTNGQPAVTGASLADLKVGTHIALEGSVASNGRTITPTAVIVLGAPLSSGN